MEEDAHTLAPDSFPPLLREIDDPPEKLYLRGSLPSGENKTLCVVGSRKYTGYGKEVCETLLRGLRGQPVTIVSGLALGIDAIAHKAALDVGLQTLAVPGSGLNDSVLYPASHLRLARSILSAGGGLLSEFEPDFKATPWSFPKRNRIMAGLSHATLIVEATERSGTLITARLAGEYNRDVLAVPGSIFSQSSSGPHRLIQDGATPISSSDDLKSALGLNTGDGTSEQLRSYDDCSDTELKLISLLTEPLERDTLIRESGLSASEINTALSTLEIKGHIKEALGVIYLV